MRIPTEKPHKFERFELREGKEGDYDHIPKEKYNDCFVYKDGRPLEPERRVAIAKDDNGEPIFFVIVGTQNNQIIRPTLNGKVKYARIPIRQVFLRPGYHIWVGGQEFIGYKLPVKEQVNKCCICFEMEEDN